MTPFTNLERKPTVDQLRRAEAPASATKEGAIDFDGLYNLMDKVTTK